MIRCFAASAAFFLNACGTYSPLKDEPAGRLPAAPDDRGVKVTFLGNTTILVTDGETTLLVDGFFSRPGPLRTLFGKIGPDTCVIEEELDRAGLGAPGSLDAILVGHAHHDHALDAVEVARRTGALVMGNDSYRHIHEGNGGNNDPEHLWITPRDGTRKSIGKSGKFTVTFVPSGHVGSHRLAQRMVEGDIEKPFKMPAHFSRFKCGDVHAIHIKHDEGSLFVTTTAGVKLGSTRGLEADVVFLGVGLLGQEPDDRQKAYWEENVTTLKPSVVVPVHWDDFSRKLSKGLRPPSLLVDDTKKSIGVVKNKAGDEIIHIMDLDDSIYLKGGKVLKGPSPRRRGSARTEEPGKTHLFDKK
ncbi:MBL fold metallo-hydrolase [Luteolibacter yonseiensis]|uniref:MBL fold metallo-hydrolase n=1 Tax=Luteolibacter yonseiensis TaxID=1144680 RepID=A0A934R5P1_9BACT|nr:MBL fold metallo-hydrolase [Luteolibacter yonseiensis]MBK1815710.1 MBL fold metallo-hydrolase [Luteolibacter yonseiensis]